MAQDERGKVSKFDLKLINLLKRNSRSSISEIAKTLKSSRQRVDTHIKQLEERDIIQYYPTVVDHARIGYPIIVYSYLRIDYNHLDFIIESLSQIKEVTWITKFLGRHDLALVILAKSLEEYLIISEEKIRKIPGIREMESSLVIKHYYLSVPIETEVKSSKRSKKNFPLDQIDYDIIEMLKSNARILHKDIASHLKLSPQVVSYRIKQLVKNRIIRIYTVHLNHIKMGNIPSIIDLDIDLKLLDSIVEKMLKMKEITWVDQITGRHDLSIYAVIKDRSSLQHLIAKLAKIDGVRSIHSSIILMDRSNFYI